MGSWYSALGDFAGRVPESVRSFAPSQRELALKYQTLGSENIVKTGAVIPRDRAALLNLGGQITNNLEYSELSGPGFSLKRSKHQNEARSEATKDV